MDTLRVFVSHSSLHSDFAKYLKRSLQALEDQKARNLDVEISEDIEGSTDWRKWIEDNVRSANVFLLLYPHAGMDLGWPNYELGRFYDASRHVVTIKNVDIAKPPPAFEPYQAYSGDEEGIFAFLEQLFVSGVFSNGAPLNGEVGNVGSEYYSRARGVARELARMFTNARVRDQFYERRIVVSLAYTPDKVFDPARSAVEGNHDGLNLLGLRCDVEVSWAELRDSLGPEVAWPKDLERLLPAIAVGELPPALSPFVVQKEIYIPVVARASTVDDKLRSVALIFVAADADQLQPLFDWTTPPAMPEHFALLIRLVRMMFRARWDILEPGYQELSYRNPPKERVLEIAQLVVDAFERMRRDAERQGFSGLDKFYYIFDRDLRRSVEATGAEYGEAMGALVKASTAGSAEDITRVLKRLLDNNARWLEIASKQVTYFVEDLRQIESTSSPAGSPK